MKLQRSGLGPLPGRGENKARDVRVGSSRAVLSEEAYADPTTALYLDAGGPGTIPGLEWAGEVAEVGTEVEGFRPGDRVMCSGSGGYAEYAVTDYGRASPIPADMSFETATTLPLALQTMHDAIITNGRLQPGESILIQGASSGVGLMGPLIARWRGAAVVIGTSTNAERRARLAEFGATLALDTKDPDWPEQVRSATADRGVDVIIGRRFK